MNILRAMKKIIFVFSIVSLLWISSCGKKDGNGSNPDPDIPSVDITFSNGEASFNIGNNGPSDSSMDWDIVDNKRTFNDQPRTEKWFDPSQSIGKLSGGETKKIILNLISGLAPGKYTAEITINYTGGSTSFTVTATVGPNTSEVQVRVNAASLEIINPTNKDLNWTIELTNSSNNPTKGDWFDASPERGVAKGQSNSNVSLQPISVVNLEPKKGLEEGLYRSVLKVIFDQSVNCPVCTFDVRIEVRYPEPVVPSNPIDLKGVATFSIGNDGDSLTSFDWNIELEDITFNGKNTDPWFRIDPERGNVSGESSQDVTLNLNDQLSEGSYSATLRVNYNDGEEETFKVTSTIRPAEEGEGFVPIKPLSLTQSGSAVFSISNSGPTTSVLSWTITTEQNTRDGAAINEWLNISPRNATTRGGESTPITLTLKPSETTQPGFYRSVLCVDYKVGKQCFAVSAPLGGQQQGDFELSYDTVNYPIPPVPENVTIRGAPLSISRSGNFNSPVTLEVVSAPSNVSVTQFNPNPLSNSDNYSSLTIAVGAGAPAGDHKIKIKGAGGGIEKTVDIPLTIQGNSVPASFSLSLDPTSLSINTNSSVASKVIVNAIGGFDSIVNFSASNKPNGVNVSFSPASHKNESTINVSVSQNAVPGQYAIPIIGKGDGKQDSVTLSLNIIANDSEDASIRGSLKTENRLADFSVPMLSTSSASVNALQITSLVEDRDDFVPKQLLVKYRTNDLGRLSIQEAQKLYETRASEVKETFGLQVLQAGSQDLPELVTTSNEHIHALLESLNSNLNVEYAEPNYIIYQQSLPNDAKLRQQVHLPIAGLPVAWEAKNTTKKVIAVLDSGIDTTHPDLQGIFYPGRDFCGNRQNNACTEDNDPKHDFIGDDHGTHVTGIIAAIGNNTQGVAGVVHNSDKFIVPVKVFYQSSFTTVNALARALHWAAGIGTVANNNPADIITMSLGTDQNSQTLANAIQAVANKGVLIIAAAGNFGQSTLLYPARYDQVMSVGSINSKFQPSCFSHFESGKLDIVAFGGDYDISSVVPGVSCPAGTTSEAVLSTMPSNDYGLKFGTSQATPIVAGVAALVWAQNPSFSANQVKNRLKSTAYTDNTIKGDRYGAGILRADRALNMPGPSDDIVVTASGAAKNDSDSDTVKLNLQGTSNNFTLNGLKGDNYTVEASSANNKLVGSTTVQLGVGQNKIGVSVFLQAP